MYTKGYRCVVNAISSKDGQDCARKSRADKGSTAVVIKCRWQHILTNYEIQCFLRLDYLNLITVIQAAFLRTCMGRSQWSSGSAPDCKHCHGYYYYYYYYYYAIYSCCFCEVSSHNLLRSIFKEYHCRHDNGHHCYIQTSSVPHGKLWLPKLHPVGAAGQTTPCKVSPDQDRGRKGSIPFSAAWRNFAPGDPRDFVLGAGLRLNKLTSYDGLRWI